jgi:hypothetical protein
MGVDRLRLSFLVHILFWDKRFRIAPASFNGCLAVRRE